MKRPEINISPNERGGRIVIGLLTAMFGLDVAAFTGGTLAIVLAGLLVIAGLDLVVTGALGHCPLYNKLGHVPSSLRSHS